MSYCTVMGSERKICKRYMCVRRSRDGDNEGCELVDNDRLSELPDCLIHCVMNYLPIGDAVRTSVLSKRFRHCWKGKQVLKFDEEFNKEFFEGKDCWYSYVVLPIVRQIKGPLYELELHVTSPNHKVWDGVNEDGWLVFPTCVYSSSHLTKVSFKRVWLSNIPFYMSGFSNLVSLVLLSVDANVELLEALISKSPKLKSLVLVDLNILDSNILFVEATELRMLEYRSSELSLRLSYFPSLSSATIYSKIEFAFKKSGRSTFEQFLDLMPEIEDLNLGDTAVASLIDRQVPVYEPIVSNLIATPKMLSCTMSLIRTALNLKQLEFNFCDVILRTDSGIEAQVLFSEQELLADVEALYQVCLISGAYHDVVLYIREIIRTAIGIRKKRNGISSQ